jgi:hypothetical protein
MPPNNKSLKPNAYRRDSQPHLASTGFGKCILPCWPGIGLAQTLLARDDVDAVDCTLPNYLHQEVILAAAAAGNHIYCEEPLAMNVAESNNKR